MKKRDGIVLGLVMLVVIVGLVGGDGWTGADREAATVGMICKADDNSAQWFNVTNETGIAVQTEMELVYNSSGQVPNGNCTLYTNLSNGTMCCPLGFSCNPLDGICSRIPQDYCGIHKTSSACNASNRGEWEPVTPAYNFFRDHQDSQFVGNTDVSVFEGKCENPINSGQINWIGGWYDIGGKQCKDYSRCLCVWNEANQTCGSSWKDGAFCDDGTRIDRIRCDIERQGEPDNRCDSIGKIIQDYTATAWDITTSSNPQQLIPASNYNCTANPVQYDCGAIIVVPFFTFANLLVSMLGIGIAYFFFHKKFL
jgi:hypothetical protein